MTQPETLPLAQQSLYEKIAEWCNESGVSLGESEKLGNILDAYFIKHPAPDKPEAEAVAWLIIHDVGHGLIEKEVVFEPVDDAIPLCVKGSP